VSLSLNGAIKGKRWGVREGSRGHGDSAWYGDVLLALVGTQRILGPVFVCSEHGDTKMHVYLRWYVNEKPDPSTQQTLADEWAAKAEVRKKFLNAQFSEKFDPMHKPGTMMLGGIGAVVAAYYGPMTPGKAPIADILYPG
jgi:hypothetical protein